MNTTPDPTLCPHGRRSFCGLCKAAHDKARADMDARLAQLNELAEAVGRAMVAATLAPGEELKPPTSDTGEHAIVSLVLGLQKRIHELEARDNLAAFWATRLSETDDKDAIQRWLALHRLELRPGAMTDLIALVCSARHSARNRAAEIIEEQAHALFVASRVTAALGQKSADIRTMALLSEATAQRVRADKFVKDLPPDPTDEEYEDDDV